MNHFHQARFCKNDKAQFAENGTRERKDIMTTSGVTQSWRDVRQLSGWQLSCCQVRHLKESLPRLNIKTVLRRYGDPHVKDKTVPRPSYHGDPYTGKTTSLYWDPPRIQWCALYKNDIIPHDDLLLPRGHLPPDFDQYLTWYSLV